MVLVTVQSQNLKLDFDLTPNGFACKSQTSCKSGLRAVKSKSSFKLSSLWLKPDESECHSSDRFSIREGEENNQIYPELCGTETFVFTKTWSFW